MLISSEPRFAYVLLLAAIQPLHAQPSVPQEPFCHYPRCGKRCEKPWPHWQVKRRMACVGDSVTSGQANVVTPTRTYPDFLQNLMPNWKVRNYGLCGGTVLKDPRHDGKASCSPSKAGQHGGCSSFPVSYWYSEQYEELKKNAPWDVIVLMFGTNGGGFDITGCEADGTGCDWINDYIEFILELQKLGPKKDQPPRMILVKPMPVVRHTSKGLNVEDYGSNATRVHNFIQSPDTIPKVAKITGLDLLDPMVDLADDKIFTARRPKNGFKDIPNCTVEKANENVMELCALYCGSGQNAKGCDGLHPNDRCVCVRACIAPRFDLCVCLCVLAAATASSRRPSSRSSSRGRSRRIACSTGRRSR